MRDLITLDMGGTSTDVSLISDGVPDLAPMTKIDGLPVKTPVIDIVTVGAGGGSIGWVDDGGLLRVGPQSAGAEPGPACYGRGGEVPTVTDAHMIRGSVRAESFLGGEMKVDPAASRGVFAPLAEALDISVEELADSVIQLAESNIVRAIQQVSTERGRDPRGYAIVPFGGAGPLHAARVAEELGVTKVVVPPHAGVLSAAGLLMSDYVYYRVRTRKLQLADSAMGEVRETLAALEAEVDEYLQSLGVEGRGVVRPGVGDALCRPSLRGDGAIHRRGRPDGGHGGAFGPFRRGTPPHIRVLETAGRSGGDCFLPCRCESGAARRPQSR